MNFQMQPLALHLWRANADHKIVLRRDWGHLLTLTLTSDDLESHIIVNVFWTSNIMPSFIKIGQKKILLIFWQHFKSHDSITRREFKNLAQEILDVSLILADSTIWFVAALCFIVDILPFLPGLLGHLWGVDLKTCSFMDNDHDKNFSCFLLYSTGYIVKFMQTLGPV